MAVEELEEATQGDAKEAASSHTRASAQPKTSLPEFGPGDQVRVWCRIKEQDRVRLSPFEGIVVRRRGAGISESFTVRRVTHGEGVERVFPIHAPLIERVEVVRRGRVHRARLYYLRTKIGKTRIASAETGRAAKPSDEERLADATPSEGRTASAEPRPEEAPSKTA